MSILEPLAEVLTILMMIALFIATFAMFGCDRVSVPVRVTDEVSEESSLWQGMFVKEKVVSVSNSYAIVDDGVLRVHRTDLDEYPVVATIEQIGVSTVALYETPLASSEHPVALLAFGVPDHNDGKGVAHVFSINAEGAHLQEEITPFRSATVGFGHFVQFEHVDDIGWWLCIKSIDGESYASPIGRWF